jgi:general secretion pathway protein J
LKAPALHNHGFTLLEMLIAIFLFSVLATTLFTAYRTLFMDTGEFERSRHRYEMAQACLTRMACDLESLYVALPPLYNKPGFEDPPEDFRIIGDTAPSGPMTFGRLRFTSLAHVSMDPGNRGGIAEIRYYVHTGRNGSLVLRRSDTLYPYPSFEEKKSHPVLCEDVKWLAFKFVDESGEEFDAWNSDSADFKYATPVAIGIELDIGDEDSSSHFETRISLPVARKAEG